MPTKQEELVEHQRWKLLPQFAGGKPFDELLDNEFVAADRQFQWQTLALRRLIHFAVAQVPYYRNQFQKYGLTVADIKSPADLPMLPVLTKADVLDFGYALRAARLPSQEALWGTFRSSGTTGRPVTIVATQKCNSMFTLTWHRQARWFRMNPAGAICDIRLARDIKLNRDGTRNPDGAVVQHPRWRYLGQFFETGPEIAFNNSNNHEQQLKWLREFRPTYVVSDPGLFEELALANGGRSPCDSIQGLISVGAQLTDSLRQQLDRMYGVPIHLSYGLNEIGKVALRCEAGRYHVHTETCLVEIVDDNGQPRAPGESGRIVVTGIQNLAMPLIRYETGDIAQVVAGPCPCGRTLPSFGEIAGRFRRYAGLPAGTRERFTALRKALTELPTSELAFLRQYQLHQFKDNRFELRLRTDAPIPAPFCQYLQQAWSRVALEPLAALEIVRVESVARSPSGKALDFTSDCYGDDNGASR